MVKSQKQSSLPVKYDVLEVSDSTITLIEYGVQKVFEALRNDIQSHPGGIERFAEEIGVVPQTVRCWWNPRHGRQMSLSNLVTFFLVNQGTNVINALNTVSDMFSKHRELEARRKLQEIRNRTENL